MDDYKKKLGPYLHYGFHEALLLIIVYDCQCHVLKQSSETEFYRYTGTASTKFPGSNAKQFHCSNNGRIIFFKIDTSKVGLFKCRQYCFISHITKTAPKLTIS